MKILFILNQLPFPPGNGVTIPSYNYMAGLAEFNEVSLLFLRDSWYESSEEGILQNSKLVKKMWVMDVVKKPKWQRALREIKGKSFFHIGREYDSEQLKTICSENRFDVIWISDDGILDIVDLLRAYSQSEFKAVAGINDSITAVFRQSKKQMFLKGVRPKERFLSLIKWLRSFRAGAIEYHILRDYDVIHIQSELDRKILNQISSNRLDKKIMVLPNGVEARLFQNELNAKSKDLVFVGSLRGYSRIVEWLLEYVWPSVKRSHSDAVFHIIGKGASETLLAKMANTPDIVHTEYVADISAVYKDKAVSISPVFKNYGLINKVVESMAAAIPVVADQGSFSCIPEFQDGRHGLIANDAEEMIRAINRLLGDTELRKHIGQSSRELVGKHFRWDDRVRKIHVQLNQ